MRVLLTGAAGFIGSHIIEHIFANRPDWEIVALASFRHRGDSMRYNQAVRDDPRVSLYRADLTAPLSPRLIDQIEHSDIIINAAAESHVDRSISDPRPFIENNVSLAITMLEYARIAKPKVFFQISTDEVYGPAEYEHRHQEWSPIIPSNPYSASKAAQEAVAIAYWRTFGVPVVITNTMNNFGERQDPEKYIPKAIRSALRGETLTVHGSEGNIGSRFYLHARNHADALLYLANYYLEGPFGRAPLFGDKTTDRPARWNVVGEREIDNLELAQMVAHFAGRELKYELEDFHSTRPGHDPRYALDDFAIRRIGWRPPIRLEESLERMVKWTLAHPEWLSS